MSVYIVINFSSNKITEQFCSKESTKTIIAIEPTHVTGSDLVGTYTQQRPQSQLTHTQLEPQPAVDKHTHTTGTTIAVDTHTQLGPQPQLTLIHTQLGPQSQLTITHTRTHN